MDFKVEFEINPQSVSGTTSGVKVRIEINGDSVAVSGFANGQDFDGVLLLQKNNEPADRAFANTDECWINGKWYNPCPTDPPHEEVTGTEQVIREGESE
jgi:hypothetical protein